VGTLALPLHESHLVHFRKVTPLADHCIESLNNHAQFDHKPSLVAFFTKYFQNPATPIIPPCQGLEKDRPANQLLKSSDHIGVGLMQISMIKQYEESYFIPGKFLSVSQTARTGLEVYLAGYETAYNDLTYGCIHRQVNGQTKTDYRALIRGAWAIYNSGAAQKACRFANPSDPWNRNDVRFQQTLENVLSLNDVSIYYRNLSGGERAALTEIVTNFLSDRNDRAELDRLLH
jgi:coenzyme F420-reducing hydrogenase delta subunit